MQPRCNLDSHLNFYPTFSVKGWVRWGEVGWSGVVGVVEDKAILALSNGSNQEKTPPHDRL